MLQPMSSQVLTVEEYLAGEQDGEVRREYVAGHVYAMTGASARHALIVGAFFAAMLPRARERGCQLFANDMKVYIRVEDNEFFYSEGGVHLDCLDLEVSLDAICVDAERP